MGVCVCAEFEVEQNADGDGGVSVCAEFEVEQKTDGCVCV